MIIRDLAIETFTNDRPTDWTKAHRAIDKALDRWQVAALES